jgi:citrate lyase synthetase
MTNIKKVITGTQSRIDDFCQISLAAAESIESVGRGKMQEQSLECVFIANSAGSHGQRRRYLEHMIQKTQCKMHWSPYW